jgi:hypothetical protein
MNLAARGLSTDPVGTAMPLDGHEKKPDNLPRQHAASFGVHVPFTCVQLM